MLKTYLFASLMSIWFVLQRYLCLFCSPSVPQDYCHPKNNPLPSTTTWFSLLPCAIL